MSDPTPPAAGEGRPIVTVGAVVENAAGEILVVRTHKWRDTLGVPGGKIDLGETQEQALVREMREETGLEITDIRFLVAQDCVFSDEFYKPSHMVLLNYHCRVEGTPAVTLNDEAQSYHWVTPERALEMDLNGPTRVLIEGFVRDRPPA